MLKTLIPRFGGTNGTRFRPTLGNLTEQCGLVSGGKERDLVAKKDALAFPPVAAPCVNVCGCVCAGARWPNYSG